MTSGAINFCDEGAWGCAGGEDLLADSEAKNNSRVPTVVCVFEIRIDLKLSGDPEVGQLYCPTFRKQNVRG